MQNLFIHKFNITIFYVFVNTIVLGVVDLCYTESVMKVLILYRPNSEHARIMEDFIHEYQQRHQSDHLEILNIDSRDGSATASLYDVMQYPAIIVLQNDGYVQKIWQGDSLPMMDEVASYARA